MLHVCSLYISACQRYKFNNNFFQDTSSHTYLSPRYVFHTMFTPLRLSHYDVHVYMLHVLSDNINVQLFSAWHCHYRNVKFKAQVYLRSHFLFFSIRYDYIKHTISFWLHPDYCYITQSIFFFLKSTVISLS